MKAECIVLVVGVVGVVGVVILFHVVVSENYMESGGVLQYCQLFLYLLGP